MAPADDSRRTPTVVVVGAGISGLAAAWEAADAGADVVLLDADRRAGGKLGTASLLGRRIDTGADAFLARRPEGTAFVQDVGLGGSLTSPATSSALVWSGGRLQRLPDGLLLGLPSSLVSLARSRVLSPLGVARAALDLVLPGDPVPADVDVAVGPLVRRRLGAEIHDRLVDPLLGGINAGDSDHLSLQAGVPQLAAAVQGHRSLVAAAWLGRRRQRRHEGIGPVFSSVKGGLGRFADQVARKLAERGSRSSSGSRPSGSSGAPAEPAASTGGASSQASVPASPPTPWSSRCRRSPPPSSSNPTPTSAARLGDIASSSVAMVCLAYREDDVAHPWTAAASWCPAGTAG